MPRTGDRRPGPGLRVLAKFVENGVCVVRSRAGRRPRRSRPGRPDRDEHAGRRARRAAHDSDRGHRVRPGAGATLRRGAARVCVVAAGTNDSTATGSSRRGGTPGAASGTERTERAWPDSSAISTPPGRRASAHQEHHRDAGGGGAGELLNAEGPLQRGRRRLRRSPPEPGRSPPSASPQPCVRRSPPRTVGPAGPSRTSPPRSRPAPCSGWGGRLRVTDLAAQLGATGRHRSSAQTPDRWTVVAKMLPQR